VADAVALAVYAVLLALAAAVVWRRPIAALFIFLPGLAAHNLVMSLLWGAGVRGNSLEAIAAWKEALLAVAVARVAYDAGRARRLAFRPGVVDALALAFGGLVVLYAILPQGPLGGHAGTKAVLYGLRHDLVPVAAYFLGRSLVLGARQLRSLLWTLLGAAAAVAAFGLIDDYAIRVEWWRHSGAVGYFHDQLGFNYHGPGGLPENFAFNTSHNELFRRLISTFVSPLAAAYMFVVALLVAPLRRTVVPLVALLGAALLFTISRSALAGLIVGLVVLAAIRRIGWPIAAAALVAAAGIGFAYTFTDYAPKTHFFASDLKYQEQFAKTHPGASTQALSPNEPSFKSHVTNLRDGLKTVGRHPQGYGLGNSGATAERFGVQLKAGESNYTEIGVETGLAGLILFVAWNLVLLAGLLRAARTNPAAAVLAAALAAVLAIALQTDAYGIPWLGYCLWWVCGALLVPAPESRRIGDESPAAARTAPAPS
jgi:hypothetical protein